MLEEKEANSRRSDSESLTLIEKPQKTMTLKEYEHFLRDIGNTEDSMRAAWDDEDYNESAEMQTADAEEKATFEAALEENAKQMAEVNRKRDTPKGEKLLRQADANLKLAYRHVDASRRALEARKNELEETRKNAGDKADKSPYRSMIIVVMAGEVEKAESKLKEALKEVEKSVDVANRAHELNEKEARYLPLYEAFARQSARLGDLAFTIPSMYVIVIMCIFAAMPSRKRFTMLSRDYCKRATKRRKENPDMPFKRYVPVQKYSHISLGSKRLVGALRTRDVP